MDQQSYGLDAENVRSLLGDGPRDPRNGAPGCHSNGTSHNGTQPTGTRPSSTAPQPIILPRRLPALDWPTTLYDDTSHDLDAANCSGEAMLRIIQRVRLPGAWDPRVVRLHLGQRSDWRS